MISILSSLTNQQLLFLRLDLHSKSCLHQGKTKFKVFSKCIYGLKSKEKKLKRFLYRKLSSKHQSDCRETHSYTFAVTPSPPSPAPTPKCSMCAVSILLYDFLGGEGGQEQQDIPDCRAKDQHVKEVESFFSPLAS